MTLPFHKQIKFMMTLALVLMFMPSLSVSSDLLINQTTSTGYQPQFQIVGNRIYYAWHEDHGPTEPIWVGQETIKQ